MLGLLIGVGQVGQVSIFNRCLFSSFEFKSSLVQEFQLFWEFKGFTGSFAKFSKICQSGILRSLLRDWLQIGH